MGLVSNKKTKKGNDAIDNQVIAELIVQYKHDDQISKILDLVLKCRSYTSGMTTIQTYKDLSNENHILHPHVNTNRAITGRESSTNPNLQNVRKAVNLLTKYPIPARKCFRARPGYILYFFDYAGVEMRVIIELTGEEEMYQLIIDGGDPHRLAAEIFYGEIFTDSVLCCNFAAKMDKKFKFDLKNKNIPNGETIFTWSESMFKRAQKLLRNAAKNMNFAIAYGAALPTIAEGLGLSIEETRPGFNTYCKRFPKIVNFTPLMRTYAKKFGYVETLFGRKLWVRKDLINAAGNTKVQGTATAGLIKRAQIQVDKVLSTFTQTYNLDIHLLLPVHDELIIEAERRTLQYEELFIETVSTAMTDIEEVTIPLAAEVKRSTLLWSQAKEIKI
jgi:DNA polymerase-1